MAKTLGIAQETLDAYFELDAQIKALEAKREEVKQSIKEQMKAHGVDKYTEVKKSTQVTVSLTTSTRTTINYKEFAAVHPRLAKKFAIVSSYETLSIRKKVNHSTPEKTPVTQEGDID